MVSPAFFGLNILKLRVEGRERRGALKTESIKTESIKVRAGFRPYIAPFRFSPFETGSDREAGIRKQGAIDVGLRPCNITE